MKALYVSTLLSQSLLRQLYESNHRNPGFSTQKFHRLLSQGIVANNIEVQTLSAYPISFNTSKKIYFKHESEVENDIKYTYAFFINLPIIRHICLFLYAFIYTFHWSIVNKSNKVVICDVLNISICLGALLASRIIKIKCVGIMTDMPGLMVGDKSNNLKSRNLKTRLITSINKSYLAYFTHYVFLTKQMNDKINIYHRPHLIMEGLVDIHMVDAIMRCDNIVDKRIILYAGRLHERYGLKMLIDAFMQLPEMDIVLSLYGSGPLESYIKECASIDSRIQFHGVMPNETIVKAEFQSTLLVNPRPTHEEFTKYSFPSKNMEYMVSGTPLLTTALPGMPQEYYPYVYIFKNETTEGYKDALHKCLSTPKNELKKKGNDAKNFVIKYKNNHSQAKRIIELIS